MRYLELLVTDIPDNATAHTTHTEWIHRDHIETIEPYTAARSREQMLWLELTLTSGRIRYVPIHPVRANEIHDIAAAAIHALLDIGHDPVHAAALTEPAPGPAAATMRATR